jgi:hypothetical protein
MKTSDFLIARTSRSYMILVIVLMIAENTATYSQETKTVFSADSQIGFVWGIELKAASVQNELGTQYGMYAGALFNHAVMVGIVGAANVTHPTVNYGYTGLMVQYTFKPNNLVHLNAQLTIGNGSTKDYETEKSSVLDNFGNVTGANFYFIEPGINGEINLGVKTRLVLGVGYRFVRGIDQDNEKISKTHVSDSDLSCFNITVGIKFGLY